MTLTDVEIRFLSRWTTEVIQNLWSGHAHRLQQQHGAMPDDLATLVVAWGLSSGKPQSAITDEPAPEEVTWPWSSPDKLSSRAEEARKIIDESRNG